MRRRLRLVLAACSLVLAAGCGGAKAPEVRGSIKVDPNANPDLRGRPSPVVVRIYELKALAAFNGADFFTLFEKESEALGGDLVAREEYQLRPAETREYRRQLQPDTKFIGVIAAFRDLENARWRQSAPVPKKGSPTVTIAIEPKTVTVTVK
jgi:type VI secretion system protein VasD